jgi:predicted metalloprotease
MADDEQVPPLPGPKVGHFLPGGAGDQGEAPAATPGDARTTLTPPSVVNRQQLGLGKARPVGQAAPALDTTHLRATQPGGAPRVGWHRTPTRTGVQQFSAQPPALKSQRRFSNAIIATFSVLVLIVLGGGVIASYKIIDSFDNTVDNPLSRPSVVPSQEPLPAPPQPTVTVTVTPPSDEVRVKKNKLYTVGKVPSVKCTEPKVKPNSELNVLKYYRALLPCFNETWEPLVLKAGYPFRQPKLTVVTKKSPNQCNGEVDTSFYCGVDESINMNWQDDVKSFKNDELAARTWMLDTMAHEYGHHVQLLTNIMISSGSREGWMKSPTAKLEENRRFELQATCLGSVVLGANKASLGLRGAKLDMWEYQTKHSGDEYNPKKVRDHGSRKNQWAWAGPAFDSANPASCNTFTAPPAKVS